jgi:hypothetical protein
LMKKRVSEMKARFILNLCTGNMIICGFAALLKQFY